MTDRRGNILWVVQYKNPYTERWKVYSHECYPSSIVAKEAMLRARAEYADAKTKAQSKEFRIMKYGPRGNNVI